LNGCGKALVDGHRPCTVNFVDNAIVDDVHNLLPWQRPRG